MTDEFYQVTPDQMHDEEIHEPESEPTPAHAVIPQPTFWQVLRANLGLMSRETHRQQMMYRLEGLNEAIESHPEAIANYVLRGELELDLGQYEAAIEDFEFVLAVAQKEIEENTWGIVAQAAMERAHRGLHKAEQARSRTRNKTK